MESKPRWLGSPHFKHQDTLRIQEDKEMPDALGVFCALIAKNLQEKWDEEEKLRSEQYTKALLVGTEAMLARCSPGDFLGRMGLESMSSQFRAQLEEEELRKKIFYDRGN